jgi:hypothetical protein
MLVMMVMVVAMMVMVFLRLRRHRVGRLRAGRIRLHGDGDDLGLDRRIEGNVGPVAEHELQGVLAGRQRHGGFGLALAEMDMLFVDRDRLGHFLRRQRLVDQQVVMSDVRLVDAGRRDAHVRGEAKNHLERAGDSIAILEVDEVGVCALGNPLAQAQPAVSSPAGPTPARSGPRMRRQSVRRDKV